MGLGWGGFRVGMCELGWRELRTLGRAGVNWRELRWVWAELGRVFVCRAGVSWSGARCVGWGCAVESGVRCVGLE